MSKLIIPKNYNTPLTLYETQKAIGYIKRNFEKKLGNALNIKRVSAPLIVTPESGLNDNLSGIERPVNFSVLEDNINVEIVHSLAKWKRMALHKYNFPIGEGLYTDMNAIRRDEIMDNTHSIYVDQWDWEIIIEDENRNLDFLKEIVNKIVNSICDSHEDIKKIFPALKRSIKREVTFITSQQLENMYPNKTCKEKENLFLEKHKTAFIMQIGDTLNSGKIHDNRAPDYDDWNLNGDILFWDSILEQAMELSSMGIRVNKKSLEYQLDKSNSNDRKELEFHKMLLKDELPLTIGGGIGQSRLCMLMLEKAHVGEVQVSIWDDETLTESKKYGINIL